MKTKMQLMLGKKTPWKGTNYRKSMSAKFWTEMKAIRTQNYEKTHWHWLWKKFRWLRTDAAHKNRKRLVLFRPDSFNRYRTHRFATDSVRFFAWNLTWNSLVRQWIFLENCFQASHHAPHVLCWLLYFLCHDINLHAYVSLVVLVTVFSMSWYKSPHVCLNDCVGYCIFLDLLKDPKW